MQVRAINYCKILSLITVLIYMEFRKFMEFIYFRLFTILVKFLDELVTYMSELVLKG